MTDPVTLLEAARLRIGERTLDRVLLPTDFTDKSWHALGLAVEIAASARAELHLLHVETPGDIPPSDPKFPSVEEVRRTTWASSPDTLRSWSSSNLDRLVVHTEVRRGESVVESILDYVEETSADLIVMGTAARTGLARAFMGSVAERVLIYADCPVVTFAGDAPQQYASPQPAIVAPVDFSEASIESMLHAADLTEQLGGTLHLFHAITPTPAPSIYGDIATTMWTTGDIQPSVEHHLDLLAKTLPDTVDVSTTVRPGPVASTIVDFVEEQEADLVVIGSHGLTGFSRFLLGSVAQKVARTAPVPVLVFKPDRPDGTD